MNESKKTDLRMWERWRRSGAIGTFQSAERHLRGEFDEDPMTVAGKVRADAMKLLDGKDENVRRDLSDRALILEGKKKLENTIFEGADLSIGRYRHSYGSGVTYSRQELYVFYPDHVLKITRDSVSNGERERYLERLGTGEYKVGRDELKLLLEVVKASTQFKMPVSEAV